MNVGGQRAHFRRPADEVRGWAIGTRYTVAGMSGVLYAFDVHDDGTTSISLHDATLTRTSLRFRVSGDPSTPQ
jgi:hypothetical protein